MAGKNSKFLKSTPPLTIRVGRLHLLCASKSPGESNLKQSTLRRIRWSTWPTNTYASSQIHDERAGVRTPTVLYFALHSRCIYNELFFRGVFNTIHLDSARMSARRIVHLTEHGKYCSIRLDSIRLLVRGLCLSNVCVCVCVGVIVCLCMWM